MLAYFYFAGKGPNRTRTDDHRVATCRLSRLATGPFVLYHFMKKDQGPDSNRHRKTHNLPCYHYIMTAIKKAHRLCDRLLRKNKRTNHLMGIPAPCIIKCSVMIDSCSFHFYLFFLCFLFFYLNIVV